MPEFGFPNAGIHGTIVESGPLPALMENQLRTAGPHALIEAGDISVP